MWTLASTLLICALGQAPAEGAGDSRAKAIAPFVDSGTVAVLELDLEHAELGAQVARLMGDGPANPLGGPSKRLVAWSESLRQAGARELFVVLNFSDMPGVPLAVVPLVEGADAAEIGRLFCGGGKQPPLVHFPTCATIRNAVVAGTPAALERVRGEAAPARPELAAAFASVGEGPIGLRLLLVPSAEIRRIVEETVPNLPRELGGGPISVLSRGLLWAAAGLNTSPKPSFKVVVASPSAEAAKALQGLGQNLITLAQQSPDVKAIFPDPARLTAQFKAEIVGDRLTITADSQVVAGLIESVMKPARESAARAQCTNNEKQIGLAMHNYASTHKYHFPPAYSVDKAGKPLLSWRVLILPWLDQAALFKEFHLDEPWDSPHNRGLIARMPATYRCPLEKEDAVRAGKTRYLAPRGAGTIFHGAEPVAIKDITDGTSYTIMVVDAGDERAVIWTRPDDWDVLPDPNVATTGVFNAHRGMSSRGTNAALADGAVRFFSESLKPAVLRALISYAGGEVISSDDL